MAWHSIYLLSRRHIWRWKIRRSGLTRDQSIARRIYSDGRGSIRTAAGESDIVMDSRAVRTQLQDKSMARGCLPGDVRVSRCVNGDGGRSGNVHRQIRGIQKLAAIRTDHGGECRCARAGLDSRARSGGKLAVRGTGERHVSIGRNGERGCVVSGWAAEQRTPNLVAERVDFTHYSFGTWNRHGTVKPAVPDAHAYSGLADLRRARRWLS